MRRSQLAVTSHAPVTDDQQYAGAALQRLKLTSYSTSLTAGRDADNDYYKTWRWRHGMTSYDDVNSSPPAPDVCQRDDLDSQQYVEHIYESPKFERRHDSDR